MLVCLFSSRPRQEEKAGWILQFSGQCWDSTQQEEEVIRGKITEATFMLYINGVKCTFSRPCCFNLKVQLERFEVLVLPPCISFFTYCGPHTHRTQQKKQFSWFVVTWWMRRLVPEKQLGSRLWKLFEKEFVIFNSMKGMGSFPLSFCI